MLEIFHYQGYFKEHKHSSICIIKTSTKENINCIRMVAIGGGGDRNQKWK